MDNKAVQKRHILLRIVPLLCFLAIWVLTVLSFWCLNFESDAMAYSLIFFYLVLPVSAFITAFFIGRDEAFGHARWLTPLFYGILFLLAEYLTFSLANMIAVRFEHWNSPSWELLLFGIGLSLAGVFLGFITRVLSQKRRKKKNS